MKFTIAKKKLSLLKTTLFRFIAQPSVHKNILGTFRVFSFQQTAAFHCKKVRRTADIKNKNNDTMKTNDVGMQNRKIEFVIDIVQLVESIGPFTKASL